jgi:hypothetical protein
VAYRAATAVRCNLLSSDLVCCVIRRSGTREVDVKIIHWLRHVISANGLGFMEALVNERLLTVAYVEFVTEAMKSPQ